MLLSISHHVLCWVVPTLIQAEFPWRSTAVVKFRSKVKCNRLTAQPLPCVIFGLAAVLVHRSFVFHKYLWFSRPSKFWQERGSVELQQNSNVCVQTDVLYKQVIPLILACTLPFVSSKDMMEEVLLEEGQ